MALSFESDSSSNMLEWDRPYFMQIVGQSLLLILCYPLVIDLLPHEVSDSIHCFSCLHAVAW